MNKQTASTVCVLMIVLGAAGCRKPEDDGTIRASGHIEATEIRLAAKVGGRLLEAPLEEGQTITAGILVARFDTVDAEHQLAQARANAEAADAQLRLLLAGSRAEDLRRAEDQMAQAQAELDAARRDLDRLSGLADRGSATEKSRDDAATRKEIAERAVAAARAQLDKLVAGPRRQEIEAARAKRASAEAMVAAVEQQITDATVLAPTDGVVTTRIAEPGEILPPGATIAILTDLARPWLTVWIDEPSLSRLVLGQGVTVRVDGSDQSFEGTISFISPVAEFTPKNVQTPDERAKLVFRVKVRLDNTDGVFKPGMPADAHFG
ncbi:MAG: HlyD family efflux transporter periplasmic adaptor subunit [Thermoanaerobaculales bacterium]|nr:HlyD family efflux transporter periplasmic adaptor subunit [Thermoanaerobaculales bacterium]